MHDILSFIQFAQTQLPVGQKEVTISDFTGTTTFKILSREDGVITHAEMWTHEGPTVYKTK